MDIYQKVNVQGSQMNTKLILATLVMHQTQVLGDASKIIKWNNTPHKSKMIKYFSCKYIHTITYIHLICNKDLYLSHWWVVEGAMIQLAHVSRTHWLHHNVNQLWWSWYIINFQGVMIKLIWKCFVIQQNRRFLPINKKRTNGNSTKIKKHHLF